MPQYLQNVGFVRLLNISVIHGILINSCILIIVTVKLISGVATVSLEISTGVRYRGIAVFQDWRSLCVPYSEKEREGLLHSSPS